jgi:hypothetical protein
MSLKSYFTHWNGGRPFRVDEMRSGNKTNRVEVFKHTENYEIDENTYLDEPMITFCDVAQIFVDCADKDAGNTILLNLTGNEYVFICEELV